MFKYIPHKQNPHSWRTFLFVFLVLFFSAGTVFLFGSKMNKIYLISTDTAQVREIQSMQQQNIEIKQTSLTEQMEEDVKNIIPETPIITVVPDPPVIERNKNPETVIEEAKIYAKPQILSGKYIDISLKYQNMVIFEDGKAIDAYRISSGKKGFNTPTGTFKIENKSPRAWSKKYGLWMPFWMAFLPSGEMGIHELPVWPGGYREGASHLGTPVSHGCVRLGVGAAKSVYGWADLETPIIIHQ